MNRFPHLIALLASLFVASSAFAEPRLLSASGWVPIQLSEVQHAIAKGGDRLFSVVHEAVLTAAVVTYPVIDLSDDAPSLRAFWRTSGDRGALRPRALSSMRAETDSFLGVALFAGREEYTSSGGASIYGVEGGAAIQLLERLDLTARYRMLGYDDRNPIAEIDSEISAPLFGFKVKF